MQYLPAVRSGFPPGRAPAPQKPYPDEPSHRSISPARICPRVQVHPHRTLAPPLSWPESTTAHVGTAAPGCPVEQRSTADRNVPTFQSFILRAATEARHDRQRVPQDGSRSSRDRRALSHESSRLPGCRKDLRNTGLPRQNPRHGEALSRRSALLFQGSSRRVYPGERRLGTPRRNQGPAQNRKEKTNPGSHPRRLELQRPKAPAGEREWVI